MSRVGVSNFRSFQIHTRQRWKPNVFSIRRVSRPRWVTRSTEIQVEDAQSAIDTGLIELEQKKRPGKALEYFNKALELNPNEKEAGTAAYNIACCYVQTKDWDKAADQLVVAVKDYRLSIEIPKNDQDLAELRRRPEWEDVLSRVPGSMTSEMKYNMISELRSPFRFFRFWIFGGLSAGASIGLVVIASSLINAISNQEDFSQPLRNLAINIGALLVFGFLFYRDYQEREKLKGVIEREDQLSGLQIERSPGFRIPLLKLRGTIRPVIICGSRSHCQKSIKSAQPYKTVLKERGIAIIPVVMSSMDDELKSLKKEFGGQSENTGFGEEIDVSKSRKAERWELKIANYEEWKTWIEEQKEISGLTENSIYFQVQLDGSVRSSGTGMPPWESFISDLPPMDDIRTKLTDNIGM